MDTQPMTPEERADRIEMLVDDQGRVTDWNKTHAAIAAAIREAVKAEREACAALADEWAYIWGNEYKRAPLKHMIPTAARAIGMKIRARSQE